MFSYVLCFVNNIPTVYYLLLFVTDTTDNFAEISTYYYKGVLRSD